MRRSMPYLVVTGALGVALLTGCISTTPAQLSNDPGVVSANLIETESGDDGNADLAHEICIRYDANQGRQVCLENTPADVANACPEKAKWPDCKRDPKSVTKATDD